MRKLLKAIGKSIAETCVIIANAYRDYPDNIR